MAGRAHWRRRGRRAVSEIVAAIILTGITITAGTVLWLYHFPTPPAVPTLYYVAQGGLTAPVWGDPTDCTPVLPMPGSYYLGNGSGDPRYTTYMNAWWSQCENGHTGTYNNMNVTEILVRGVSQPVRLADVQFNFICHNNTPAPLTTFLVRGSLQAMSWFPGSAQVVSPNAPTLGSCATFNASGYGGGANSVYYNRLGYFQPLGQNATLLQPGDTFILYVHSEDSVLEAPSPLEPRSVWYQPDFDDYHGAPPWCFANPGACHIELIDTGTSPQALLADIQLSQLA